MKLANTLMTYGILLTLAFTAVGQSTQPSLIKEVNVTSTDAIYLGTTAPVTELARKNKTSKEKRNLWKSKRHVPDNFKGRSKTKVVKPELEHQGPDKIRQTEIVAQRMDPTVPLVNVDGITDGRSPTDPSGDIGLEYYVQAVNSTEIAIFNKEGEMETTFAANTLWSSLGGVTSLGDPIVLYDEQTSQWIITEFTGPTDLLIAVSVESDPFGSYHVYRFSAPRFPDYPKYGIWNNHLVVTSNETGSGAGRLHQYFIDRAALMSGADDVAMQRVEIVGANPEQSFLVSTPVDWNGLLEPLEDSPIVLLLDDSSWGNATQDGLRLMKFNVDMENEANTTVDESFIPLSPYDSYPCAATGVGFSCIPQRGGGGLDGLPELILNVPHYRRFETHETIVFTFVTDVTDGDNVAGVRWTELRRTEEEDWFVYQEGTFAPDDDLHRWMAGIAIDKFQNIGMAYSVSGFNDFAGLRYTGRRNGDPLGQMTIPETTLTDGFSTINAAGRFGDYTQMSIDPTNGTTFWFTGEYAGSNTTNTRIAAFELSRDTFDLAVTSIDNPQTSDQLTMSEAVEITIANVGVSAMESPSVSLMVNGVEIVTDQLDGNIEPLGVVNHTFSVPADLSAFDTYNIEAVVSHPADTNPINNTRLEEIRHLPSYDLSVIAMINDQVCLGDNQITAVVSNNGFLDVDGAVIEVSDQSGVVATMDITTTLLSGETREMVIPVNINASGNLEYTIEVLHTGAIVDFNAADNTTTVNTVIDENSVNVEMHLVFDDYSEEVSYEIFDISAFSTIYEGDFGMNEEEFRLNMCLSAEKCYLLILRDSYNDGFCCSFGLGTYTLSYDGGETILSDQADFGSFIQLSFCPDSGGCILNVDLVVENTNDQSGSILISASNGQAPYTYSIDGGLTFQDDPLFTNLTAGEYPVVVVDASGECMYESVAIVESILSNDESIISTAIKVSPNPSTALFNIAVHGQDLGKSITLQVLDSSGRLIQQQHANQFSGVYQSMVSLMDRPAGKYFIKIQGENHLGMTSIIKL